MSESTVTASAVETNPLAVMLAEQYGAKYAEWSAAQDILKSSSAPTAERVSKSDLLTLAEKDDAQKVQDYNDLMEAAKQILSDLRTTYAPGTSATEDDIAARDAAKQEARTLRGTLQEFLKFGEAQAPGFSEYVGKFGPLPVSAAAASGKTIRRPRIESATLNGERVFNTLDASARPRFSDIVLKIKGLTGTVVETPVIHAAWLAASGKDNVADITEPVTFSLTVAGPGEGSTDFVIGVTPHVTD